MKIDIITLFPKMFDGPFSDSILARAQAKNLVEINIHDLRKWGLTERHTVDDRCYGGGVGMIMRVDVIDAALKELRTPKSKVILLDAGGRKFNQGLSSTLSKEEHLILIAGHYEGIDHRVHDHLVDEIISIGDYILTGGEIPSMVLVDSICRLIPGVIVKEDATKFESFSDPNLLEYPQYTRPEEYNGWKVPEVLLSGNHGEIEKWRNSQAKEKTNKVRPDLG